MGFNMDLEKKHLIISLFLQYESLLTETQQQYFKAYFLDDFSLKEIAEAYHVSRSAIHDAIHKIEDHLMTYESKLKLHEKAQKRLSLLDTFEKSQDLTLLKTLKEMDE
jgi:predicted DNA-binding protein YlxM (UPF0122 family)